MTVEVLETTTEIVEVIEQGPQGAAGPGHNPLITIITDSKWTLALPYHDGLDGTEVTVQFGEINNGEIDITAGILTALVDLNGFSSNIEMHTTGVGGQGKTITLAIWSEVSADSGVTWVVVPGTLHTNDIRDASSGSHTISIAEGNIVPAGTQIRLRCTKLGSATGTTLTVTPSPDLITSNGTVDGDSTKATMFYRIPYTG